MYIRIIHTCIYIHTSYAYTHRHTHTHMYNVCVFMYACVFK